MLMNLLLAGGIIIVSMGIQVAVVVKMIQYVLRAIDSRDPRVPAFAFDTYVISMVLLMLFAGLLAQIAVWAVLFEFIGEFDDFATAFYHSTVNFASLGYGDIVMSEEWRLLGALEASHGVLMFGLSAGTMLAVMTNLFALHKSSFSSPGRKAID